MAIETPKASEATEDLEELTRGDAYTEWQKKEGVKVIHDFVFEDMNQVELADWPRKGGKGAIINIPNDALPNDCHVVEIGPGKTTPPEKHMYEEMILILSGRGSTSVWFEGGAKQTFEWGPGGLFSMPLNAWYQMFNGSGTEPLRYLAVTNLPPMLRLFRNEDFIFENPFQFRDRFSGEAGYFNGEGKLYKGRKWQTNFVPDAANLKLYGWKERGAGGINAMLELPQTHLAAHISQFPVGTYKKAHRHGPGAHLMIMGGQGFSLLWQNENERRRANWKRGGMVVVPWEDCFHQHFNTGPEPARYLALRGGGASGLVPSNWRTSGADRSLKDGGWQVEYEDENPEIHKLFEEDLAQHGAVCKMKNFISTCTGEAGPTFIDQRD
jgi:oxalate decarboxylase/phosphoglucose isomerase-like protein (cupin superfamily)